jgi:hypothetical protein
MFPRLLFPVGLLAVAAGVFTYLSFGADQASSSATDGGAVTEAARSPAPSDAPAPTGEAALARTNRVAAAEDEGALARRAEIDRKRSRIRARLEHRTVDEARPAPRDPPPEPPKLDKEYIRDSVRELIPVIRDCYDSALEDDDALGGKLVMQFEILGDEDVGGVVDQVEVEPNESTIANLDMRECVRESMYTLELPPPAAGGRVMVTYPFVFSPE